MSYCPHCKASYSGLARLCRNCGKPVPPASIPPGEPEQGDLEPGQLRVCASCGLGIPSRHASCDACGSKRAPRVVPRRDEATNAFWSRARCSHRCASSACKEWSPTISFSSEGRALCALCGHEQDLPLMFLRTLLRHAHDVVEQSGSARSPYERVGRDLAELPIEHMRVEDDLPRDFYAGPGHPICGHCNELVGPPGRDDECSCPCGKTKTIEPPPIAKKVSRSLVAMITIAPRARAVQAMGAVTGLACPSCSAPLDAPKEQDGASVVVTCKYCQRTAVVDLAGQVRTAGDREPALWFLFRPSPPK